MNACGGDFKVYSTSSLTRVSGGPSWAELVHSSIGGDVGMEALGNEERFCGRLTTWQLGCLHFVLVRSQGVAVRAIPASRPRAVRNPNEIWLGMCLAGQYEIGYGGSAIEVGPARIAVLDPARRRSMTFAESCELLWVRIPRVFVSPTLLDEQLVIDGTRGAGRLVQHTLLDIVEQIRGSHLEDQATIAEAVIKLIAAALGPLQRVLPATGSTHRALTLQRVKQHVEGKLGDETLSVQTVAAALGLSARYINKLFECEHTSLMRWTWNRRLESAHLALQSGGRRPISEVAYAFGFKSLSHFSRNFRARYAQAPSTVMRHAAGFRGERSPQSPGG